MNNAAKHVRRVINTAWVGLRTIVRSWNVLLHICILHTLEVPSSFKNMVAAIRDQNFELFKHQPATANLNSQVQTLSSRFSATVARCRACDNCNTRRKTSVSNACQTLPGPRYWLARVFGVPNANPQSHKAQKTKAPRHQFSRAAGRQLQNVAPLQFSAGGQELRHLVQASQTRAGNSWWTCKSQRWQCTT